MNLIRVVVLVVLALSACDNSGPTARSDPQTAASLQQMKSAIAAATGYSSDSLEILVGAAHMRISISDSKLAEEDQAGRESAATAILSAAEQSMAADARFGSIQQVSVAIIHPAAEGANAASHTEDVVDFRRAPSQRFSKHIS
ncbi:MAG: hypothetical protein KGJ68_02320 [Gammaproteobacteria bacterium]|nr:hypothetical protein [Gammaproteobacteria bacterium]